MDRNLIVVGIAFVLVVGLAVAVAVGPLGGLGDGGDQVATETPTGTAGGSTESGGGGTGGSDGSGSRDGSDGGTAGDGDRGTPTSQPPMELVVDAVEPCGQTCRDVTATLSNNQDRRATGVTVDTTIYAGEDAEGDVVWEGTREVGTLVPGESERETTRIELGWLDAAAVQGAGGEVTIETVVETDRQSFRFVERRDVS